MKLLIPLALVALTSAQGPGSRPERPDRQGDRKSPNIELEQVNRESRVAWYSIWEDAKAEAERSGRPILLMSAAPRCNDVPGMW